MSAMLNMIKKTFISKNFIILFYASTIFALKLHKTGGGGGHFGTLFIIFEFPRAKNLRIIVPIKPGGLVLS
jgi:hypothetical protein